MKHRYEETNQEPLRTKDIILDLCRSRPAILKLKNQGKEYDPLIDVIAAIDLDDENHAPIPSSKDLQAQLVLKPAKLKRWVNDLYEDFLTAIRLNPDIICFTEVEHMFCIYGLRNFVSFSCRLPITPRIGEVVNLPFVSAHMGGSFHSSYYVYKIEHQYSNSKVVVVIWAKSGSYNKHVEYLKDKADFDGKLSRIAQMGMDDYEIEKKLKEYYR